MKLVGRLIVDEQREDSEEGEIGTELVKGVRVELGGRTALGHPRGTEHEERGGEEEQVEDGVAAIGGKGSKVSDSGKENEEGKAIPRNRDKGDELLTGRAVTMGVSAFAIVEEQRRREDKEEESRGESVGFKERRGAHISEDCNPTEDGSSKQEREERSKPLHIILIIIWQRSGIYSQYNLSN